MSMEYVKHDEKIKQIAVDVTRCIKNRVTIDWINQDNIKAAIHQDVTTILFKFVLPQLISACCVIFGINFSTSSGV